MMSKPHPTLQHVRERENIILKAVIYELALTLGTPLIPTAKAAGVKREALWLAQELEVLSNQQTNEG